MANNRNSQSAAIRFGPALKAFVLCFVIAGSAVGYVWQKEQIYRLGQQIWQRESRLTQLKRENQILDDQLAILQSPLSLDRRARELNLGLAPAQPSQVFRLPEPSLAATENNSTRQFANRQTSAATQ
jgi:cell division protein FtsB